MSFELVGPNVRTNFNIRRFNLWMEQRLKLHKEEERRKEIVRMFATTYEQQLENLLQRSALRLQRNFRARKAAKLAQADAQELLGVRRHLRDERERAAAERRAEQRRLEEERERRKQLEREAAETRRKEALEERKRKKKRRRLAEKKFRQHQRSGVQKRFKQWQVFRQCKQNRRKRHYEIFRKRFLAWKFVWTGAQREKNAASLIQSRFRGLKGRRRGAILRRVGDMIGRTDRRLLFVALTEWHRLAKTSVNVKSMMLRAMRGLVGYSFDMWRDFRTLRLKIKRHSSIRLQRWYRHCRTQRFLKRILAAIKLQNWIRTHFSRGLVNTLRARQRHNKRIMDKMARRMKNRKLFICFVAWHKYKVLQQDIRRKFGEKLMGSLRYRFETWILFKENKKFAKKQATTKMQEHFYYNRAWIVDKDGDGALHYAAKSGSKRIVKLCLRYGIDIDVPNHKGLTPLHRLAASAATGVDRVGDYMISKGANEDARCAKGMTPLMSAAVAGNMETIHMLLINGANHKLKDNEGRTVLHHAASNGRLKVVSLFLHDRRHRLRPDDPDSNGIYPLHLAAFNGTPAVVEMFMEHPYTDIDVKDTEGRTPLMYAAVSNKADAIEKMLDFGVSTDLQDEKNMSALHHAANGGFIECIERLVLGNINVDLVDYDGDTALHTACANGTEEAVKKLLQCGVDHRIANQDGDTAAHLAAAFGNQWCVRQLIDFDVNLNVRNYEGRTPLGEARMNSHHEVMRMILLQFSEERLDNPQDERIMRDAEGWTKKTLNSGKVLFFNAGENIEMEDVGPEELFIKTREKLKVLKRKIVKRENTNQISSADYNKFFIEANAEIERAQREENAAIKMQSEWRRRKFLRWFKQAMLEAKSAKKITKLFRANMAKTMVTRLRRDNKYATIIQTKWKNRLWRVAAKRLMEKMRRDKIEKWGAKHIQRLYRGHYARKLRRRGLAKIHGPNTRQDWERYLEKLRARDFKPRRKWRLFEEWVAAGYSPNFVNDVYFYRNRVNSNFYWDQPKTWQKQDELNWINDREVREKGFTTEQNNAARYLQTRFRGKQQRDLFKLMIKGIIIKKAAEKKYLQNPTDLVSLCNYMLYCLSIEHDYEKTRPLVETGMMRMTKRGPDNAFVLWTYAIFLAATQEEDMAQIFAFAERAKAKDPSGKTYKMAATGFFGNSLVTTPGNFFSQYNYALCMMLYGRKYQKAKNHFIKALELSDHRSVFHQRCINNFNYLQLEILKSDEDGIEAFQVAQQVYAKKDIEKFKEEQRLENLSWAYTSIQSIFRMYLVKKKIYFPERDDEKAADKADKVVRDQRVVLAAAQSQVTKLEAELLDAEVIGGELLQKTRKYKLLAEEKLEQAKSDLKKFEAKQKILREKSNLHREFTDAKLHLNRCKVDHEDAQHAFDKVKEARRAILVAEQNLHKAEEDKRTKRDKSQIEYEMVVQEKMEIVEDCKAALEALPEINVFVLEKTVARTESARADAKVSLEEVEKDFNEASKKTEGQWEQYYDEKSGKFYYYNQLKGETRWKKPKSLLGIISKMATAKNAEDTTNISVAVNESDDDAEAQKLTNSANEIDPEIWEECTDGQNVYFYNKVTGISQWDRPALKKLRNIVRLGLSNTVQSTEISQSGDDYDTKEIDPEIWEECTDGESVYFYNKMTGKSQWERPALTKLRNIVKIGLATSSITSALVNGNDNDTTREIELPKSPVVIGPPSVPVPDATIKARDKRREKKMKAAKERINAENDLIEKEKIAAQASKEAEILLGKKREAEGNGNDVSEILKQIKKAQLKAKKAAGAVRRAKKKLKEYKEIKEEKKEESIFPIEDAVDTFEDTLVEEVMDREEKDEIVMENTMTTNVIEDEDVWEENITEDGNVFYYNVQTGESKWTRPKRKLRALVKTGLLSDTNRNEVKSENESGPIQIEDNEDDWEENITEDGNVFYYNVQTGESKWTRPKRKLRALVKTGLLSDTNRNEVKSENESGPIQIEEEDSEWEENETENGEIFFYSKKSGESVWEKPAGRKLRSLVKTGLIAGTNHVVELTLSDFGIEEVKK
eukprot:g4333.t1